MGEQDHVYKVIELVGSSGATLSEAIQNAVSRAAETVRGLRWFEVSHIRGHIEKGKIGHYQVSLKLGFTIED